jgi:tRNA dimethylallyltransferase
VPEVIHAILLLGPTASGKTALSLEIARMLAIRGVRAEIVSADSMQVYVGMDIGTAKPSRAELELVPHRMIDVADPYSSGFTVEEWLRGARLHIDRVREAGGIAVITGGTNLYVQALVCGLFEGPPASPEIRARLGALAAEELRELLERRDPAAARRIHRNDIRRTVRALEVLELTGSPISALQVQWESRMPALEPGWRAVGLMPAAAESARRINARVGAMIDEGFVDEVRALRARGDLGRQAAEAVGYRELAKYLDRRCSLHEATEAIKVRTRRLARQQRTWLRRFSGIPGSVWLEPGDTVGTAEIAARFIASLPPK